MSQPRGCADLSVCVQVREEKADGTLNEFVRQIATADRIIVNKTDLVSKEELATVVATVRGINSEAPLVQTVSRVESPSLAS